MTRNRTRHVEAGFSLVETIAAMGILALAALPLIQVASDATGNTARLELRLLARTVAENALALAIAEPLPLEAGAVIGRSEQLGRVFEWTRVAGPAQAGEVQTLTVSVRREGDEQVLAQLQSLKAVPAVLVPGEDVGGQDPT